MEQIQRLFEDFSATMDALDDKVKVLGALMVIVVILAIQAVIDYSTPKVAARPASTTKKTSPSNPQKKSK